FLFHPTPPAGLLRLSLHDALPISPDRDALQRRSRTCAARGAEGCARDDRRPARSLHDDSERRAAATSAEAAHHVESERSDSRRRSEEHTSELQSRENLVCRLLLEK